MHTVQVDPFGHSSTQASLMTGALGFDAVYFGRADYQVRQPPLILPLLVSQVLARTEACVSCGQMVCLPACTGPEGDGRHADM